MSSNKLTLIGGSVRSGKSAFALALARRAGGRRVFIATAEGGDAEMRVRIVRHREERGGEFETVEEPLDLLGALGRARGAGCVVVDCLTLWVANLLLQGESEETAAGRVEGVRAFLAGRPFRAILVTNEVGMGVVPENALARAFRDACGRAHQAFSREADEVYFAALGVMLRLKPGPVEAVAGP